MADAATRVGAISIALTTTCPRRLLMPATTLSAMGAIVHITSARATMAKPLPFVETGPPITDALALVLPFYVFVKLVRSRGYNPDAPGNFKKVTETR
ncbi:hypothetical protein AJ87_10895 [Rhizobium yanglingense]|nr:hypothetical protein AJ87_10895 [Rhizobium yanglingense]